jgi:hypothetical protein
MTDAIGEGMVRLEPGQGSGRLFEDLSRRFRDRRNRALRAFIGRLADRRPAGAGPFRILDLGGSWAYWERVGLDFLDAHDVEVICVNHLESELRVHGRPDRLQAAVGDARHLPHYADMSFDLVHSNSVVEHVGRFPDMMAFAREVNRLAPAHYVQTPYMWFPIDPHFPRVPMFHWLPESWRAKLLLRMKVGWSRKARDMAHAMQLVEGVVLLDRRQFRFLFPQSRHRFERFLLLPKSMIAERQ